jgi:hypothetical protein
MQTMLAPYRRIGLQFQGKQIMANQLFSSAEELLSAIRTIVDGTEKPDCSLFFESG